MMKFSSLKHSIRQLNSFVKENIDSGSTFQNQAMFNILVKNFDLEVSKAKDEGLSTSELNELLKEENKEMGPYKSFVAMLVLSWKWSNKKESLN